MKNNILLKTSLFVICAICATACYRMPYDDEYSVIPTTNNPDLTRERPSENFAPNMGF